MRGKGRRRREKNYRAAHGGGHTHLPPPPDFSQVDALPSKLRRIMSFTSNPDGPAKDSNVRQEKRKKDRDGDKKRVQEEVVGNSEGSRIKDGVDGGNIISPQQTDNSDEIVNGGRNEKRKNKRKRKHVADLRFETVMEKSDSRAKKRERKKRYLESKKMKHKKAEMEETLDFPGREKIQFGEVVEAPPKLATVPKPFKSVHDASQERIRLQAIEAYRNRKGWTSRPGLLLPSKLTARPSL